MPLLLADRATAVSPLPLLTPAECRMLGKKMSAQAMRRVRKGVYVDRPAYDALPPWSKYAVRVHAFALKNPDAILCLESAAVLHGLPLFGETLDIHVFDPERTRSRRFGDVVVHTSNDPREVERANGLVATSILDAVIDLGRALPPAQALSVSDSAISPAQGGPLTLNELQQRADEQQNARGRALLRWIWSRTDELAESPAESISRAVIEWRGFEKPELQREFRYEGALDRTDFFFPSTGTIGEADGWQKYRLNNPDTAARQLADEKRREDRLRRHGHPFARWELADAWNVKPLDEALIAAKVKRIAPPQLQLLATLGPSPRTVQPRRRVQTSSRA